MFRDIREQIYETCYFHDSEVSIITPRYLICSFRSKEWHDPSFVLMCISTLMSFFFGDLIIIKFVLDMFIDSLLTSHHSLIFSNSEFIRISSDFKSLAEANTFVSSANIFRTIW
jgi:hypothetical protein